MATRNPAEVVGAADRGRIEPGAAADLVLWNEDLQPAAAWVEGRLLYSDGSAAPRTPEAAGSAAIPDTRPA
jgi:N-acetylglucosamine-6-phosphate deacetylase